MSTVTHRKTDLRGVKRILAPNRGSKIHRWKKKITQREFSRVLLLTKYYYSDQIKEDEICRLGATDKRKKNYIQSFGEET
jgi:hypothetical protein